jgi:hypothetical protein
MPLIICMPYWQEASVHQQAPAQLLPTSLSMQLTLFNSSGGMPCGDELLNGHPYCAPDFTPKDYAKCWRRGLTLVHRWGRRLHPA